MDFPGIITARKRSLRRLRFYTCLSVHGGVTRPTPGGGEIEGSGWGSPGPHSGGLQAHTWVGCPGPGLGVYPSMH